MREREGNMRIAIAGIVHETNTYCKDPTPADAFFQLRGKRLLKMAGTETSTGGAIDRCRELDIEIVPILYASAQPSGTIESGAYEQFKNEILDGIKREQENAAIDGIFLELHGAGVVHGVTDLEGDLTRAIRHVVGEAIPITAAFDLHGNITQTTADALDGIFSCHLYPHTDMHLRAREAIDLIVDMLEHEYRPVTHVKTIPMLAPTTTTMEGIGKSMLERMLAAESEENVIDVSWFHGFPYTDIPEVGAHIAVTTRGDREQAENLASRLASVLWDEREQFIPGSLTANQALDAAEACVDKPVVINETSDNCGCGAPGDGTHLLRSMLERELQNACFGFIVDPEVALQAHQAGVGATISVSLGAKEDDLHGTPLELTCYVKALHDGRLTMLAMYKDAKLNLGKLARLVVGGIDIIVGSERSQTFDVGPFLAVGIDVTRYDLIALKSSHHFRAGFHELAGEIITADTPGLTTHQIDRFPRLHSGRPLWPLDDTAKYTVNLAD
jgi:microcystin degradation protein MlrC